MDRRTPLTVPEPVQATLAVPCGAFAPNTGRAVRAYTAVFIAWCAEADLSTALPVALFLVLVSNGCQGISTNPGAF